MIDIRCGGVLLDIEGTTSAISFVYDVMFPFARRELESYLEAHWDDPPLRDALEQAARDAGRESLHDWVGAAATPRDVVRDELLRLMDHDVKATGLKQVQGLVWQGGFESGELLSHVYDDVPPALRQWDAAGQDVRIYSSGSEAAQRLFFGHTVAGDLLPLFRGHYDTRIGAKREAASYRAIAEKFALAPPRLLFLSDVVEELDAARQAGLQAALVVRPGNPAAPPHDFPVVSSFAELRIAR